MEIKENDDYKTLAAPDINYIFNKRTGLSAVWGTTKDEDPEWCQYGPLIADIEITTKCKGPGGKLCKFCYKANNPDGTYMSFDTFKAVFDKLPRTVQQIAFGVDAQCESNPDTFAIMKYCRDNGVIPNVTVADITDETADKLAPLCGAVAVSRYDDRDICYDTVKKLTDRGMKQVNIHIMISEETKPIVIETINDLMKPRDPRLDKLNAVVFLSLKKKGRGRGFTRLPNKDFNNIVRVCLKYKIPFGFDSCSAQRFLRAVDGHENYEFFKTVSEPCESGRFSAYINVKGEYYPCSFLEGVGVEADRDWRDGMNVIWYNDFVSGIWHSNRNKATAEEGARCAKAGISCQYYDI